MKGQTADHLLHLEQRSKGEHFEPPAGYALKASAVCHVAADFDASAVPPGSRADFAHAVAILTAGESVDHGAADFQDCGVMETFLSCPYETWLEVFGQPCKVTDCASATQLPVQGWEHRCKDGPVRCVGHLYERPSHDRWAVVARVCSF